MGNRTSSHRLRRKPTVHVNIVSDAASSESKRSLDQITRQDSKMPITTDSGPWYLNGDDEMDRQVVQHFALKTLFQGNMLRKTEDLIPLKEVATVLQVGCGPGTWIMDMATNFPASNFVGVDVCNMFPSAIRPLNVKFETIKALDRLPFSDNMFDLVHVCQLLMTLYAGEWPSMLKEIYRVLKPGGCIQSLESGMIGGNDYVDNASDVFVGVMTQRGREPLIIEKIKTFLEEAGFIVIEQQKKIARMNRSDALGGEFSHDIRCILQNYKPFDDYTGSTPEEYAKFLDELLLYCQNDPNVGWPWKFSLAQKPHHLATSQ